MTDVKNYLNALQEIEEWKLATGLIDSAGDPDGITPNDLLDELCYLKEKMEDAEYYKKALQKIVDRFCGDGDHERCSGCVDTAQFVNEALNKTVVFTD
jgi:hypothetical protein